MPPKSLRSRAKKSSPSPVNRSTAAIFQNVGPDGEIPKELEKETPPSPPAETNWEELDIKNALFPFKYVYMLQDFLNEYLEFTMFVQLLAFGYIGQILYHSRDKLDKFMENLPIIGFNMAGVFIGIAASYSRTQEGVKRKLPEFNYIYSVVLPILVGILHPSDYFLVNLSLNYFIIDKLYPAYRLVCSVVFYEMYNESKYITTLEFLRIAVMHFLITWVLNYINEGKLKNAVTNEEDTLVKDSDYNKSLSKAEIQLIALILTNALQNIDLVGDFLPLVIFQKLFVALVCASLFCYPLIVRVPSFITLVVFCGVFYVLTNIQLQPFLGDNAVVWLYQYIKDDEVKLTLIQVWIGALLVTIPAVFYFVESMSLNLRRKLWHFLILIILLLDHRILIDEVEFALISLLGSIVLFLVVEIVRYNQLTPIGEYLFSSLIKFQDFKDLKGPLNLSYIYLLVGITIPILYDATSGSVTLVRYMGIIALGMGDSMASIVGKKYGSVKWRGGNKSVQGTFTFFSVNFLAFYVVDTYLTANNSSYTPVASWENLFVANLIAAILEGSSDLNDNFFIPIILPISYELLRKCYV